VSGRKCVRGLAILAVFAAVLVTAGLGADAANRKVTSRVDPEYPEIAKRLHITGIVKIQVTIAPSGVIKSSKPIGGNPTLVQAAVDAVKKWKFQPSDTETTQVVSIDFER
jgi:TonB family protein